jgi:preprotein translocase subunit SecE
VQGIESLESMSNQPVQTVGASGDKIKVVLAIAAAIAGVVGFYVLSDKATAVRAAALVGGLIVAIALVWTSTSGRDFINFA